MGIEAQAPSIEQIERMAEVWTIIGETFFSGPLKPDRRREAKLGLIEAIAIISANPAEPPPPPPGNPPPKA